MALLEDDPRDQYIRAAAHVVELEEDIAVTKGMVSSAVMRMGDDPLRLTARLSGYFPEGKVGSIRVPVTDEDRPRSMVADMMHRTSEAMEAAAARDAEARRADFAELASRYDQEGGAAARWAEPTEDVAKHRRRVRRNYGEGGAMAAVMRALETMNATNNDWRTPAELAAEHERITGRFMPDTTASNELRELAEEFCDVERRHNKKGRGYQYRLTPPNEEHCP